MVVLKTTRILLKSTKNSKQSLRVSIPAVMPAAHAAISINLIIYYMLQPLKQTISWKTWKRHILTRIKMYARFWQTINAQLENTEHSDAGCSSAILITKKSIRIFITNIIQ